MSDQTAGSQRKYWDTVSAHKAFGTTFQMEAFRGYVGEKARILDVGCGYGRSLDELYQEGYRDLIGMDFSAGMVQRVKLEFPYLDLRMMNDGQIDLPDSSVDVVLLVAVLTCIVDDSQQRALIREILRVLKPDGVLYANDFLLNSDDRNLKRYGTFSNKYETYGVFELPEGAILRHHDEHWIAELLDEFTRLDSAKLTWTTMNGHTSKGFYFIGRR